MLRSSVSLNCRRDGGGHDNITPASAATACCYQPDHKCSVKLLPGSDGVMESPVQHSAGAAAGVGRN